MSQKGLAPILIVIIIATLVGGYLIYQKQLKPTVVPQPVAQPTTTGSAASPAPTGAEETANWKTYLNNEYGFSLRYPLEWVLSEDQYQIKITNSKHFKHPNIVYSSPGGDTPQSAMDIETHKNLDNIGIEKLRSLTQKTDTLEITEKNEIEFQGKPAIKYQAIEASLETKISGLNIGLKNGFLRIQLKNYAKDSENQQVLDQILSTFKFLP